MNEDKKRSPIYEAIETAAAKLDTKPDALRARCRRALRADGTAPLGPGIVAVKLGNSWRVCFQSP